MEVGIDSNSLMITDGGLINEQQTITDKCWSVSGTGIVKCQAMAEAVPSINEALAAAHAIENEPEVLLKGKGFVLDPPTVKLERWSPTGDWADALDIQAGAFANCRYKVRKGNGINPRLMDTIARRTFPRASANSSRSTWGRRRSTRSMTCSARGFAGSATTSTS